MLTCINKNSVLFQTLLQRSGLSEFKVEAYCRKFSTEYDRFPHLDEIPGADSLPYFNLLFHLNGRNATTIETILANTGTKSIEEAIVEINKTYEDYETYILPLGEKAIIRLVKRPTKFRANEEGAVINPKDFLIFSLALEKLSTLYGISINPVSMTEIALNEELNSIPGVSTAKAFIYNGNIYLNTDIASIDSPIHELMHLFLGSMRFTNPDLYMLLVQSVEQFLNYDSLASEFPNRTRSDVNEEIFVLEFSKFLSGMTSNITTLPKEVQYEITYNMNRLLDTILLGEATTRSIPKNELTLMTLKDIAERVNSSAFNHEFHGSLSDAAIHRMLANKKLELMEQHKLEEVCD